MISKRSRYAIHGVGFLAYHHESAPVPFANILGYLRNGYLKNESERLSLSPGYIAKVFQDLSRAGIVHSSVGRNGGYTLARDPGTIRMLDVVTAMDGIQASRCCLLSMGECDNQDTCGVRELVTRAEQAFFDVLAEETVESQAKLMFSRRAPRETPRRSRKAAKSVKRKTRARPKKAAPKRRSRSR